jgi:hypothetical protein
MKIMENCRTKTSFIYTVENIETSAIHFNSTEHSVNDYEIVALETICGDNSYRDNRKTVDE